MAGGVGFEGQGPGRYFLTRGLPVVNTSDGAVPIIMPSSPGHLHVQGCDGSPETSLERLEAQHELGKCKGKSLI